MPDENKMQALELAGFQIKKTCLRCTHFDQGESDWGTCRKIFYEHEKHTGAPRQASVPVDGWCPDHLIRLDAKALLGAHQAFTESDPCVGCGKDALIAVGNKPLCYDCAQPHMPLSKNAT